MMRLMLITVLSLSATAQAAIVKGTRAFDDCAFADSATMRVGSIETFYGGSRTVQEALTGPDLGTGFEIGVFDPGEIVEIGFADNQAINLAGPDLIVYEAWAADGFDVAIGLPQGSFSPYIHFEPADEGIIDGAGQNVALIDLASFGLSSGATVSRFLIRKDDYDTAELMGVAAINSVPEPAMAALLLTGGLGLLRRRIRRYGYQTTI